MVSETVVGMAYCVVQYCVPWSSLSSFYISVCGLLLLRSSVRRQIVLPQCIVFFFDCSSSLIKHPIGNSWQPTITLYAQNHNTQNTQKTQENPPKLHATTLKQTRHCCHQNPFPLTVHAFPQSIYEIRQQRASCFRHRRKMPKERWQPRLERFRPGPQQLSRRSHPCKLPCG